MFFEKRFKQQLIMVLLLLISIFVFSYALKDAEVMNNEPPKTPAGWSIICPEDEITSLVEQGDIIWAGSNKGLYKIDRKQMLLLGKIEFPRPVAYVRTISLDKTGRLWIGNDNGIIIYDGKTFEFFTQKNGLPDNRVNIIRQYGDQIWVGTWGGAACYENGRWKIISKNEGLFVDMVYTLCQDSKGGMWFGSYNLPSGAVSYLDAGKWTYYSSQNGLPNNNITTFYEDGNAIWIGTGFLDRGGACRLKYVDDSWVIDKTLTMETGLAGEKVCSIFKDSLGSMWFGSEMDGIAVIRSDKSIILTEGLSNPEVKVIHQDVDGNLWLGTQRGLTVIKYDAFKTIIPAKTGTLE